MDHVLPPTLLPDVVTTPPRRLNRLIPDAPKKQCVDPPSMEPKEFDVPDENNPGDDDTIEVVTAADDVDGLTENTTTLKQLKEMCISRGLPTHGKKRDLLQRLS